MNTSVRVLVADLFSEDGLKELEKAGLNVTYDKSLSDDKLVAAMGEVKPNILVVRSTKVTAAMIDADPSL